MPRFIALLTALFFGALAYAQEGKFSASQFGNKRTYVYSVSMDEAALEAIVDAQNRGKRIDTLAFTTGRNWVLVAEDEVRYSDRRALSSLKKNGRTFPDILEEMVGQTLTIDEIAFTPRGNWIIQSGKQIVYSDESAFDGIGLRQKLTEISASNDVIQSISIGASGKWIVIAGGKGYASGVSDGFQKLLRNAEGPESRTLTGAWFRPGRSEWVITSTSHYWAADPVENRVNEGFRRIYRVDGAVNLVALQPDNGVALISNFPIPEGNLADRLEHDLLGRAGSDVSGIHLLDAMATHKVEGLAVAVIRNNKIEAVRGYGRRKSGYGFIDHETIFGAASISKAVGAFGIAKAVDLGELDWSMTVADYIARHPDSLLSDWRAALVDWVGPSAPNNANGPDPVVARLSRIRLQDLLTHTGGLNRDGINAARPHSSNTYHDVLFARSSYRDEGILRPINEPQEGYLYSGGGFTLAEIILEYETGRRFREFMEKEVLQPLGMENSTFGSLTDAQKKTQFAYEHNRDGRTIDYREVPGKSAGGLFTTAEDYARFVLALMNDGRNVENGRQVISTARHSDLIRPARFASGTEIEVGNFRVGRGLRLSVDNGSRRIPNRFWHGGGQAGYRTFFIAEPDSGLGLVVLINSAFSWPTLVPGNQANRRDPGACDARQDWLDEHEWNRQTLEKRDDIARETDPPCGHRYDWRGAEVLRGMLSRSIFALSQN